MKDNLLLFLLFLSPVLSAQHQIPRFEQPRPTPLTIHHLAGDLYVYITYGKSGQQWFPANSAYLVTDIGVVMFDTPWDTTQFQPLLDSIFARHGKQVVLCISTHSHADRTAGLGFLNGKNIPTYSTTQTFKFCRRDGEKTARYTFAPGDTLFTVGNRSFEAFYPGEGHAPDNIVIWLTEEKVLYGGCFVKSTESEDLGNILDANLKEWPHSIKRVKQRFGNPKFIVPGHYSWKNSEKTLDHTLMLLKERAKRRP